MNHIFGDIEKQLESLKPETMYKYKIVASYNGGSFEEIDLAKTKQEVLFLMKEYRMAYGQGWTLTYYNIED